jgi:penicillin amidase
MKQLIATQIVNESRHGGIMLKLKQRKESRSEILSKSFKEAIAVLENQLGKSVAWTWNKVHVVEYEHALGKVALLRRIFNVGPFEVSGSNEVINNQMFDYTNESKYVVKRRPSSRRVIDFSDIENSWTILPTGQSGIRLVRITTTRQKYTMQGILRKCSIKKL